MNKIFQIKKCPLCDSPLSIKVSSSGYSCSYVCKTQYENKEFKNPHYDLMWDNTNSILILRIFKDNMFLQTVSTSDYTRLYFAPESLNEFNLMQTIPPDVNVKTFKHITELPYKDITEVSTLIERAKKLIPFISC